MPNDDKHYKEPSPKEQVPARALHHHVEEVRHEHEVQHEHELEHEAELERHARFEFMSRAFTEEDRQHVKDLISNAVHAGEFEVEVLRFPAAYLDDKGRAINNREADWPRSLTGYAESLYAAYLDVAQPLGYRIKARVLNYPRGMIGDIALVLEW